MSTSNVQNDVETPQWFVMRAYKKEKEAEKELSGENGLPYFIPKCYVMRTYHGKKKRELVPAIPSLVFVHACRSSIHTFKLRCPYLQYVMCEKNSKSQFLIVPERQMDSFIKVATNYEDEVIYHKPEEIELEKGCRVRIYGGPLDGVEGILAKVKGKRSKQVVIVIGDIMAVTVEVRPEWIEVVAPYKEKENRKKKMML